MSEKEESIEHLSFNFFSAMNPSMFEDVLMETNGHYTTVSPSVRRIRTLKRRKEQEKENSKNQVGQILFYSKHKN